MSAKSEKPKGQKMHGGLIRPRENIVVAKDGRSATREHWDGRKDVRVMPETVHFKAGSQSPDQG